MVSNSRFLILPTVKVPNLACHVLSLSLGRLQEDWEERYGVRPVLVEAFLNSQSFEGSCYKASNWSHVGYTAGRGESEKDITPIEWMLYTTVPIRTFEEAKQGVEWYSGRWGIEVYHRTLKSGCRIKDRQLGSADRLESKCLTP